MKKKLSEIALKDRLKNLAKKGGKSTPGIFKRLYMERFLARVAASSYADKIIFKGGDFLSYLMPIFRETVDIDFLVSARLNAEGQIKRVFTEIGNLPIDDGFEITFVAIKDLSQPHMPHPGFRIIMNVRFREGRMNDNIQIDVGIGDEVTPDTRNIPLMTYKDDPLFEDSIPLAAYPPENIFAEKLSAVFQKAEENSRMKDFNDLVLMIRQPAMLDLTRLKPAIISTFKLQKVTYRPPITYREVFFVKLQGLWSIFLNNQQVAGNVSPLSPDFARIIEEINAFLKKLNLSPEEVNGHF